MIKKNNIIPKCKCGCDSFVLEGRNGWNSYLKGHSGGGQWQTKYKKDSKEYKNIVEKISKNVSLKMSGIKKTAEHCKNISIGRKKLLKEMPQLLLDNTAKMKCTKQKQSKNGELSKKHFTKNKYKNEIDVIYKKIGEKSSKTKLKKFKSGELQVWNKNKNRFNDERIKKCSGENHYRYNPNKIRTYDDKFFDKNFRKYLLKKQNYICIITNKINDLVLHHIDENKLNSNENNLIYLYRGIHTKLHSNKNFKVECDEKIKKFLRRKICQHI